MSKLCKTVTVTILVIATMLSAVFGVFAAQSISKTAVGKQKFVIGLEEANTDVINFLLIGTDKGGTRSDTIMLLSVDGYSNRVSILSIPRDTMVKPKGYTRQKINAAMGIGIEGVKSNKYNEPEELLIALVKQMTGLPIHYFATVNVDGFKDIIDALDGVDFNVPYNMNYDDPVQNLHIHLKKGYQHLDGQAAHDFVRFRHNNGGSAPGEYALGDIGRQYWQQEFVKEVVRQKAKPQYISRVDDLFEVISENLETNYTLKEMTSKNHLSLAQRLDLQNIEAYQLPGEARYIGGVWWYIYDEDGTKELVEDVFSRKSPEEWAVYKQEKRAELTENNPVDSSEIQLGN
ncbi:MAG: LCP family protein [Eubacteriales bacterium]|nr:LCP family protein [Eubacteriales bacterium]